MIIMKALPVDVYRCSGADCTNNGVSGRYDRLLVLCDDGFLDVDSDNLPENLFHVVRRTFCGREIYHLEPVVPPKDAGWMMGGNYAATSDSRFSRMTGNYYEAIPIHDRQETWAEYDMLSR